MPLHQNDAPTKRSHSRCCAPFSCVTRWTHLQHGIHGRGVQASELIELWHVPKKFASSISSVMLPFPWTSVVLREIGFIMSDREGKGISSFSAITIQHLILKTMVQIMSKTGQPSLNFREWSLLDQIKYLRAGLYKNRVINFCNTHSLKN
jgi:hypothetical protein